MNDITDANEWNALERKLMPYMGRFQEAYDLMERRDRLLRGEGHRPGKYTHWTILDGGHGGRFVLHGDKEIHPFRNKHEISYWVFFHGYEKWKQNEMADMGAVARVMTGWTP